MLGTFSEAISSEKGLRLYSDASRSISLVYGGAWVDTGSSNVNQPLVVPPSSGSVVLPYLPDQLLLKSGYFSLRSCYFRVFYSNRDENTSEYIKLTVEVYVGTKSVVDFYVFRSVSICFKGEGVEVFVPDIQEMFDNLHYCKYRDCMHIKEDGCKVKELVSSGNIFNSRYDNYKSFIESKKG